MEIKKRVRAGQFTIRKQKLRIVGDSLIQQANRLPHVFWYSRIKGDHSTKLFATQIPIVGEEIIGGRLLDRGFLSRREFGLKLIGNRFGDIALNGENIIERSIITFRPQMLISSCLD